MPTWFQQNPNPTSGLRDLSWDAHTLGRNLFASNFARGGFSRTMFAPTAGERFRNAFKTPYDYGSKHHIANLEYMVGQDPYNNRYKKALEKARLGPVKKSMGRKILGGTLGAGIGAAFVALPAFTTPGGLREKGKAVATGAASMVGWGAGMKIGTAVGAAIGGPIGAILGAIGGGIIGGIAAEEGTGALLGMPDTLVERERKRRNLNWVGNRDAFNTQSAATMRQMSLQAMNRGMATARSAMGREAIMFHR